LNIGAAYGVKVRVITASILATILSAQLPNAALQDYASILKAHVKNGRVDYKSLAKKDQGKLDGYLKAVGSAKRPAQKNKRIGFYVDAYNAIVMKAVIAAKFPASVLDVKGFFDNKNYQVAGQKVSLNQLEKEILNPYAKDPRTHMVLVCAAVGCPVIENKAYFGSNINKRFDAASRRYLQGTTGARASSGQLQLSHIFKWYEGDFGGPAGRLAFAQKYLSATQKKAAGDAPKISFFEYNWKLNKR
jgi:hypothetical protein